MPSDTPGVKGCVAGTIRYHVAGALAPCRPDQHRGAAGGPGSVPSVQTFDCQRGFEQGNRLLRRQTRPR
jgi:hypothetical protein